MNIFYLDSSPKRAAQMLCDKHVVKMLVESVQILSTTYMHHEIFPARKVYKPTHVNHPSTLWAAESPAHYMWLWEHAIAIGKEYEHRYFRYHLSSFLLPALRYVPRVDGEKWSFVEPPQCMPLAYQIPGDAVAAYRRYYCGEKLAFADWTRREIPDFVSSYLSTKEPVL